MTLTSRVRPKIGDVVEISTPQGLAYAHYTHKHDEPPCYGALLRVLPGLHSERPADFSSLVAHEPIFSVFFPLGAACNRRIVTVVAAEHVSASSRAFPTFRSAFSNSGPWVLWDGQKEWRVHSLTSQQFKDFPPLGVINDTLLIDRILQGWRHEHHGVAA